MSHLRDFSEKIQLNKKDIVLDNLYRMTVQSPPLLKRPEAQAGDIYSLDRIFLSPIENRESWSFQELRSRSFPFYSFFQMRALLHRELLGCRIELEGLSSKDRQEISRLGMKTGFESLVEKIFIPEFAERGTSAKAEPVDIIHSLHPEKSFASFFSDRKMMNVSAGGILKSGRFDFYKITEHLFRLYSLEKKSGFMYLRSTANSYLYFLNPENKKRIFYAQAREEMDLSFAFAYIETENESIS